MRRRQFIRLGMAGTTAYTLSGLIGCSKNILEPRLEAAALHFCSPVDLPESRGGFYVEYIQGKDYRPTNLDLNTWKLNCFQNINSIASGQVAPSYGDTMQIIQAIISESPDAERTFFNTFQCVGNPSGGNLISNGYFTGVPLRLFLQKLGFDLDNPGVKRLYYRCFDGYHTNHKIERIRNDDPSPVYLAYRFNGIPLSDRRDGCLKHGHPIRLVVQEMLGMKSPKGLTEIEISDRDEIDGWWETRPISRAFPNIVWSDTPPLQINSKIFEPVDFQKISPGDEVTIQGVAVGGRHPVQKVEIGVSRFVDGKDKPIDWQDAAMAPRPMDMDMPEFDDSDGVDFLKARNRLVTGPWPAPSVWILWSFPWQVPETPGQYRLHARATDQAGNLQPVSETPDEMADGINSIHTILIQVK